MLIIFGKNKHKKVIVNELALLKAKKDIKNRNIIVGDNVVNSSHYKCSKCNSEFSEFDVMFVEKFDNFIPSCPNCKVNILENEFFPL